MTTTSSASGKCLCGQVEMTAAAKPANAGACHCETCRRWGGGPFITLDCGTEVTVSGEEHVSIFDSSDWAERGFCKHCGTHLFYRLKENQHYHLPASFFGNEADLEFDHQVFIDQKPSYYAFANNTKNMTGEELFALFGSS